MTKQPPTIERLREALYYDSYNGDIGRKGHPPFNAAIGGGYVYVTIDEWLGLGHRVAWAMTFGYWPDFVDHKDNNRSNNKLDNLREANSQQNNFNRGISIRNKTGVKGVQWEKARRRWRATVCKDGKQHVLRFKTLDEAVNAVREMRNNLHGEFANHGDST